MYQYILFDLDGTLTDPGLGITNSVAYALAKYNIRVEDRRELYRFIGPPLLDSFQTYYGFSEEQSQEAIAYYREYFRKSGIYENVVYDGVPALLAMLKKAGKQVILATSKPEEFAREILRHFALDGYFDYIAGATMNGSRSKKGDVIAYALESCGIQARSKVLMIGDRKHDVLGAREVGVDVMGVLYGYGSEEELRQAGANYIAPSVQEIGSFIFG